MRAKYCTAILKIDYPVHDGQPNPAHGKFIFVGSIPGECYDFERRPPGSKRYDTEDEEIAAAKAAGVECVQKSDCSFV